MWGLTSVFGMGTGVAPTLKTVGKPRDPLSDGSLILDGARSLARARSVYVSVQSSIDIGNKSENDGLDKQISF